MSSDIAMPVTSRAEADASRIDARSDDPSAERTLTSLTDVRIVADRVQFCSYHVRT